jgi:hypothetical protein
VPAEVRRVRCDRANVVRCIPLARLRQVRVLLVSVPVFHLQDPLVREPVPALHPVDPVNAMFHGA